MPVECTTSSLPAIGQPLPVPAPPPVHKAVGAVRNVRRARRWSRRTRRAAAVIVTCVTVGGAAAAVAPVAARYFSGASEAPPAVLVAGAGYGADDYGALQRSALGASYLPAVTGQSIAQDGAAYYGPEGVSGGPGQGGDIPNRPPVVGRPPATHVPEPASIVLFITMLAALWLARRSRRA